MRVLHVIPAIAPCYGGPSQVAYHMCRALQAIGCKVQIATTDADGEGRLPVELGHVYLYQDVPTILFPRQWSEAFKFSQPLARWLSGHVRDFDVVHIHAVFSHASVMAARACRNDQIPYVVRTIGSLDPWGLKQKRFRKRLFWHLAIKQMLQEAAAVHYTTRNEQKLAENTLKLQQAVTIPLGVDNKLLQNEQEESLFLRNHPSLWQKNYVLALCRLHPVKNLEALIEIFLRLTTQAEFREWKLVIAGDGEARYVNWLKQIVQQQYGEERILFTGWLQGAEKYSALRGAKLFALPSHQENFGLSVVEAMACGVPVLISEQVNLADEITNAGAGWVVRLDGNALYEALHDALSNRQRRIDRGDAARMLVRAHFTWPAVANELMALYRELIASASPRFAQAI